MKVTPDSTPLGCHETFPQVRENTAEQCINFERKNYFLNNNFKFFGGQCHFLHESFSWGQISMHPKFHLPVCFVSAL